MEEKEKNNISHLTVVITGEVRETIKAIAAINNITMKELVEESLKGIFDEQIELVREYKKRSMIVTRRKKLDQ